MTPKGSKWMGHSGMSMTSMKLWMSVIDYNVRVGSNLNQNQEGMDELAEYLAYHTEVKDLDLYRDFKSVQHYVVQNLNVGDVDPLECTRDKPIHSMMYFLSFIRHPFVPEQGAVKPTLKNSLNGGKSVLFESSQLTPEICGIADELINQLFPWMKKIWTREVSFKSKNDARAWIIPRVMIDNGFIFSRQIISKNGLDVSGGAIEITESDNPGARRIQISAEVFPPQFNKKNKCSIESGYGFSWAPNARARMTLRMLRDYGHLTSFVIAVWKHFWHHLDPVSKCLPPNGISIMTLFGAMGCHGAQVHFHRDISNKSSVNISQNSQILGSSVMVISLFDEVEFLFVDNERPKPNVLNKWVLGHLTVYILRSLDDTKWRHGVKFDLNNHKGNTKRTRDRVRVAIVCRWLGRRCKAYGADYKNVKRFMEYIPKPNEHIKKQFKNDDVRYEMFKFSKESMFEEYSE